METMHEKRLKFAERATSEVPRGWGRKSSTYCLHGLPAPLGAIGLCTPTCSRDLPPGPPELSPRPLPSDIQGPVTHPKVTTPLTIAPFGESMFGDLPKVSAHVGQRLVSLVLTY